MPLSKNYNTNNNNNNNNNKNNKQNVEVSNDKDDSRSLIISIRSNRWKSGNGYAPPHNEYVLNSLFTFDDHIRCMAAKQHLTKARDRLVFCL